MSVQTELDAPRIWALLKVLAQRARAGEPVARSSYVRLDEDGCVEEVDPERAWVRLIPDAEPCFLTLKPVAADAARLLALYAPLCIGRSSQSLVIGHIGQTLDGQIATRNGESRYITGPENLAHLHRLRALVDAVVVGANTVDLDDPQLTTRLVPGENPVRVVIDPKLRLLDDRRIFRDPAAKTLVVCASGPGVPQAPAAAHVELVAIEANGEKLTPAAIVAALRGRGLSRLLIEGGGVTLSRFLEARALDRLHVTIGPMLLGAGRPGIMLPGIDRLELALRPTTRRFELGSDVLFDCRIAREG